MDNYKCTTYLQYLLVETIVLNGVRLTEFHLWKISNPSHHMMATFCDECIAVTLDESIMQRPPSCSRDGITTSAPAEDPTFPE